MIMLMELKVALQAAIPDGWWIIVQVLPGSFAVRWLPSFGNCYLELCRWLCWRVWEHGCVPPGPTFPQTPHKQPVASCVSQPFQDILTFPRQEADQLDDDVIKRKHFPRYWPFVRGIHRSPVNSQHKGQWRGALMFSLICARINAWVNNREADDFRRYSAHYDVIVMGSFESAWAPPQPHTLHWDEWLNSWNSLFYSFMPLQMVLPVIHDYVTYAGSVMNWISSNKFPKAPVY